MTIKLKTNREQIMQLVENTFKQQSSNTSLEAILLTTVEYNKGGQKISVPQGTRVLFDINKNVALIGSDHVFVDKEDISLFS